MGNVEDVFLMVLFGGVPSGESHLRFKRESDGKFLIFCLYSEGLGRCDFLRFRVVVRVEVDCRDGG